MLKSSILLLALSGTCAAQNDHTLNQLEGTARVLMVFSPDCNSVTYRRQLALIEHHAFELTERNTVVVSVTPIGADNNYVGENIPLGTSLEQAAARSRYHVLPGEFLVVLINKDGSEQIRSVTPVDIHELTARLDALPRH